MAKTVDYYLSKGFDRKAAEYFAAGRKKIVSVVANDDFTLTLGFDNGEKRIYNASPLLEQGTVFESLSDKVRFGSVYIDDCGCVAWDIDPTVDSNEVWSNKLDLCPDSCYIDSVSVE